MRGIASVLLGLLAVVVLAGIGVGIYNAGLQQGLAQSANLPAGAVPYAYGYGWHGFGFGGLFGLIIPIFFLFLVFGLLRAAFRGGRGWGHHGYGYGPGRWMGPGMGQGMGPGTDREQWVAEMHRRLHEAEGTSSTGAGPSGSGPSGSGPTTGNPSGG